MRVIGSRIRRLSDGQIALIALAYLIAVPALFAGVPRLTAWLLAEEPIRLAAADIHVTDGDSIRIGRTRWRLLGFDAPETGRHAKCDSEREAGERAGQRLRQLIDQARTIALKPRGQIRDRYARRLGWLALDGRDAGAILISEGMARPYTGGRRKSWCP